MIKLSKYTIGEIIFSQNQINQAIQKYAEKINRLYKGQKLTVIGILNGSVFFVVELLKHLRLNIELDFIAVSSYQTQQKKTEIKFYKEMKLNLKNKTILILEDIIDSGDTLRLIADFINQCQPKSLRFCSVIKLKRPDQKLTIACDYLFTTEYAEWLVGFGLDIEEQFRHLPDIRKLNFPK